MAHVWAILPFVVSLLRTRCRGAERSFCLTTNDGRGAWSVNGSAETNKPRFRKHGVTWISPTSIGHRNPEYPLYGSILIAGLLDSPDKIMSSRLTLSPALTSSCRSAGQRHGCELRIEGVSKYPSMYTRSLTCACAPSSPGKNSASVLRSSQAA